MAKSINSCKIILSALVVLLVTACGNPYKGFKGVEKKGMKKNKTPSQQLRDDYKKAAKKQGKTYKRDMKEKRSRLGTPDEK